MDRDNSRPLWNEANLPSPSGDLCLYHVQHVGSTDFSNLVSALTNSASQIGKGHPAWIETKVFLILQNRIASKLPCDKFLHILKMIGHCIQKLVVMRLFERYLNLAELFLQGMQENTEFIQLPSRQQLEYVLLKTLGAAKLILKAINYTEETFIHLIQRMRIGHLVQTLLMTCSVIGRMRTTYMAMLLHVSEAYKKLKPWQSRLKAGSWLWPKDPQLPDDLLQWLQPQLLKADTLNIPGQSEEHVPFLKSFFEFSSNGNQWNEMLLDDDQEVVEVNNDGNEVVEVNNDDNEVVEVNNDNDKEVVEVSDEDAIVLDLDEDDVGVVQPRIDRNETETTDHVAPTVLPSSSVDAKDSDETAVFLDAVQQANTVKKMLFILKLACINKQTSLEKLVCVQLPRNVKKKLKAIFKQLKFDFLNIKSTGCAVRKARCRHLLRRTKAAVMSLCNPQEKVSDDDVVDLVESDVEVVAVVSPKLKLAPVHSLFEFHQLYDTIKMNLKQNSKELRILSRLYTRGCEDAELLQENGEVNYCNRHVYRVSKKMINYYTRAKT